MDEKLEERTPENNDSRFKRSGSIRHAMNRFRSSMRKKFAFASVRVTKSEKNQQKRRLAEQQNKFKSPPVTEDENYETYNYKGNARDAARRFVNVSRHRVQETFVAAKIVLKLKQSDTPNPSSDEEEGPDGTQNFFEGYQLSFSDEEDLFPIHRNERYIGPNETSDPKQNTPNIVDQNCTIGVSDKLI